MKRMLWVVTSAYVLTVLAGCQGPSVMEIMQGQAETTRSRAAKALTIFSFTKHWRCGKN